MQLVKVGLASKPKSVSKPHVSIAPHVSNYPRFSAIQQQNFNLFLLSRHSSKPEGYKGAKAMAKPDCYSPENSLMHHPSYLGCPKVSAVSFQRNETAFLLIISCTMECWLWN